MEKITANSVMDVAMSEKDIVNISMRIEDFPAPGTPFLDKNGASVYTIPFKVSVASLSSDTQPVFEEIKHFTVEENCPCVEVKTDSRKVIVSSNESLAVFDPETGLLKKQAPKDSIGCLVPVLRKDPRPFGVLGDKEFGWLIGMFLSDGWVSENTVCMAKLEKIKRDLFVEYCRKYLSSEFTVHETRGKKGEHKLGDSIKTVCVGKDLAESFKAYQFYEEGTDDLKCKKALKKVIPEYFLARMSEDFGWGLLSGLLDGDGTISKSMATGKPRFAPHLCTSSKYLMDSMCKLCFRLGLRYSFSTYAPRGLSNTAYVVHPSAVDIFKNIDKLLLFGEKELKSISEWKDNPTDISEKNSPIPLSLKECTVLYREGYARKDNGVYSGAYTAKKSHVVSRFTARKVRDFYPHEGLEDFCNRTNDVVDWEKVRSVVEVSPRKVYDFEVAGTKVFSVNNGLIIYDTLSYTVPVSADAVKEAIAKMMPSKNLLSVRTDQPHYLPSQEFTQGLYLATKPYAPGKAVQFATKNEALRAYKEGKIRIDTPVTILEK